MTITIIPASFKSINALHNDVPEFDAWQDHQWQDRCQGHHTHAVIATIDDKPIGYMVSYDRFSDGSLYCWMTAVLSAYRNRGILSHMMDNLAQHAKAHGYEAITIKTRNNRREMLSFLIKNGFDFIEIDAREPVSDSRILLYRKI